jgi:ribose-phosphate pyrophosphokinase
MARAFSGALNASLVVVDKRRISPDESSVGFIIGDVRGKNVLLVDDMVTTAGSLCNAAQALREAGAKDVYAAAAHAVMCGPAVERLSRSLITELVVTDSIPLSDRSLALGRRVRVLSVNGLLGEALRRIHINESVSSLFLKQ